MIKKFIKIFILQIVFLSVSFSLVKAYGCGETFASPAGTDPAAQCQCATDGSSTTFIGNGAGNIANYCCGFVHGSRCTAYADPQTYTCGESLNDATVPEGATCDCPGTQWEGYDKWSFIWKDRAVCCGFVEDNDVIDQCLSADPNEGTVTCGQTYAPGSKECICGGGGGKDIPLNDGTGNLCCGWLRDGQCRNTDSAVNDIEVTEGTLNELNPITVGGGDADLSTPGGIISKALGSFIFPIAGIILFVQLLLGGFSMLTGAANSKSLDEGKQRITAAIIGFILLFAAYWIAQLLELIFGIRILS